MTDELFFAMLPKHNQTIHFTFLSPTASAHQQKTAVVSERYPGTKWVPGAQGGTPGVPQRVPRGVPRTPGGTKGGGPWGGNRGGPFRGGSPGWSWGLWVLLLDLPKRSLRKLFGAKRRKTSTPGTPCCCEQLQLQLLYAKYHQIRNDNALINRNDPRTIPRHTLPRGSPSCSLK